MINDKYKALNTRYHEILVDLTHAYGKCNYAEYTCCITDALPENLADALVEELDALGAYVYTESYYNTDTATNETTAVIASRVRITDNDLYNSTLQQANKF